jgi:hypothetical protein
MEWQTFKTLSRDSGLSIDRLQNTFYAFLKQSIYPTKNEFL